jgi:signal transduction histidine kinase
LAGAADGAYSFGVAVRESPAIGRAANDLIETVQALSSALSVDEIRTIAGSAARRLVGSDGATFVLRAGDECWYADEDAISPLWKGQRFPMSACISGWAMLNREAVSITDIYADDRIPHDAYRPTFVKSLTMVPIRRSDPIGAIGNYWATEHECDAAELEVLQALADSVAVALERARVYEELEERVSARTAELQDRNRELHEAVAGVRALHGELEQHARETARAHERVTRTLHHLAHEVRSPLYAIDAQIEDVVDGHAPPTSENLNRSREAIREITRIVDQQLELARLEFDGFVVRPSALDVAALLDSLRGTLRAIPRREGVRLQIEDPEPAPRLKTDPALLGQALRNLLVNALKFTDAGVVRLTVSEDEDTVSFVVSDTGIGIAPEDQEGVFGEFGQVGAAQEGRAPGTGIGLALVKRIAVALDGEISLQSAPGAGSTFALVLPRVHGGS